MKRLQGVKKTELRKISSSSDSYTKKTKQPDIIEDELPKNDPAYNIDVSLDDIDFEEPWKSQPEPTPPTPKPAPIHHGPNMSEPRDSQDPYDPKDAEEPRTIPNNLTDVKGGVDVMAENKPNDDKPDIFDILDKMDSKMHSPFNARPSKPVKSTPGHGFQPTAKILQKKYTEPTNSANPSSRVTVSINRTTIPNKSTVAPTSPDPSPAPSPAIGQNPVPGTGATPTPPTPVNTAQTQTPRTSFSISRPGQGPTVRPNVAQTHPPIDQEPDTDVTMPDADVESPLQPAAPVGLTQRDGRPSTLGRTSVSMSSKPNLFTPQRTVSELDDKKFQEALDKFAEVIERSNQTIENIIHYTQNLAEAMANASQDGSRELLDMTRQMVATLSEAVYVSTQQMQESSQQNQIELNNYATQALNAMSQRLDEYLAITSQHNSEYSQKLAENMVVLAENLDKLNQYSLMIRNQADEQSAQINAMAQQTIENLQHMAYEYMNRMAQSLDHAVDTLRNVNENSMAETAEMMKNISNEMMQTTRQCITDFVSAMNQTATDITESIHKSIEDYVRVRYRDQSNTIHIMQQHIISLQQQITNLVRSGLVQHPVATIEMKDGMPAVMSAGTGVGPGAKVGAGAGTGHPSTVLASNVPPIPDSFIDPIIDYAQHSCSYDVQEVEKIVKDITESIKVDESLIYRVNKDRNSIGKPDLQLVDEINKELINHHAILFSKLEEDEDRRKEARRIIKETIAAKGAAKNLDNTQKEILEKELLARVTGIGKLQPLMDDPNVTEIMVVGKDKVFCIVNGQQRFTDIKFDSKEEVLNLAQKIANEVGRQLSTEEPHCDAKLSNGTRVHLIIPPVSANGDTIITMRKSPTVTKPIGIKELVQYQALSVDMVEFLKMCVEGRANIILYGEVNSGKTTVARALANFFGPLERIISLEDTQELNLPNFHYIPLEAVKRSDEKRNIGIHELFVDTLRMSPERTLIGEVRGKEGGDMIEAFQSGQRGSITTMHAGSPKQVVTRLVIMMSRAQLGVSENIMRQMIHDSVDLVIQCRRLPDGSRKVTRITELIPLDEAERGNIPPFRDIFKFDQYEIKRDKNGKIIQIIGEHNYKAHLSQEKLTRYFEFGVDIPEKFGKIMTA